MKMLITIVEPLKKDFSDWNLSFWDGLQRSTSPTYGKGHAVGSKAVSSTEAEKMVR